MQELTKTDFCLMVPVFNEEDNILFLHNSVQPVLESLIKSDYKVKILFVDNASTDKTKYMIEKLPKTNVIIEHIEWVRNYGIGVSVYNGYKYSNAKATLVFDCDVQDPPELITQIFAKWQEGYKFVYGIRQSRKEGALLRVLRILFRFTARFLGGNGQSKIESGTWLLDEKVVEDLIANPPSTDFLAGTLANRKYPSIGVEYHRVSREHGKSKFSFIKYLKYAMGGIFGDNMRLLRITLLIGLVNLCVSTILIILLIIAKLSGSIQITSGLVSVSIVVYLFASGLFVSIGLLSEYVGRIFRSTSRILEAIPVSVSRIH